MFNRFSILVLVALIFSSCYTASYRFSPISSKHKVSFHGEGKWLFISQSAPAGFAVDATDYAYKEFKNILGDQLVHVRETRGLMRTNNLPLLPDRQQLKDLKSGTGYDFIIHVRFSQRSADIGDILIGKGGYHNSNNEVYTIVEIYDLNNLDILNVQQLVSSLRIEEHKRDFSFSQSSDRMANRSIKKILRRLR
jgi:hypothetical protein